MALNLLKLLVGDKGADLFNKWNTNVDSEVAASVARDAQIAALQAQIQSLSSGLYVPAPGAYVAPAKGALQQYSGNANVWSTATLAGRTAVGAIANGYSGTAYAGGQYADQWTATSDFSIQVEASSSGWTAYFRRWSRTAAGVVTLNATVALGSNSGNQYALSVMGAIPLSATSVLVLLAGQNAYVVTWDGNVTLTSTALARTPTTTNVALNYSSSFRRAYLVGAASAVVYSYSSPGMLNGGYLIDRANVNAAGLVAGVVAGTTAAAAYVAQDYVGGGYAVRLCGTQTATDPNMRATVLLDLWDDQGCLTVAKVRIPTKLYASPVSVVVLSPTLAIVQFKDTSNNNCTYAVSINTAAPSLGLYGPYTTGNLLQFLGYPFLFDGLNAAFLRLVTPATGASRLMLAAFNPAASAGAELTSDPTRDVALTIGGMGGSLMAIVGLTNVAVLSAWMGGPNTLCVLYYASAMSTSLYIDTYTLS